MTLQFPIHAAARLAKVRAWANAVLEFENEWGVLAKETERMARELSKVAGDLRRAVRQQKKSGADGAAHDTRN
jgi:hypothetical protein